MRRRDGKGKANDVSGIPLTGTIVQIENQSVEPNREEPAGAFKVEGADEDKIHDYFSDEEERLGDLDAAYVSNKSDDQWSDGIADEENEVDDMSDDGLLAETQPLHVDPVVNDIGEDDNLDLMLRPTQADDDVV